MATMNQSSRIFPSGDPVPDTSSSSVTLKGGSPDTVEAPYEISETAGTYVFLFWNVDANVTHVHKTGGVPDVAQKVIFTAPDDDSTFAATAWYLRTGGGGGGGTGGSVWAFSLNKDEVVANSPIGTITPASAQKGPNAFSTTTSPDPVVVTAPKLIGGDGMFKSWFEFSGNGKVKAAVLTVPAKGSSAAIAFYGIPVPDPCESIRTQLDNLSPGDFPTPAAYEKAARALAGELRLCEQKYGELPTP
jgi:hypothetical protein